MSPSMRTPGFTAESSLYAHGQPDARRAPARRQSGDRAGDQRITPQFGRYRCSSYDEHGCRKCCDIYNGFCWWQCVSDPRPV